MLLNSTVEPWVPQYFSHTPLINPYKEITCTSRPKIPSHAHILPIWEIRSWDLKTLTQYHLYKEKPYAHGILVSPTPLYKQQASSYHRYMKILLALVSLSHGDSSATNLTIEGFLASTPPVLSVGSLFSCFAGTQLMCVRTINSLMIFMHHNLVSSMGIRAIRHITASKKKELYGPDAVNGYHQPGDREPIQHPGKTSANPRHHGWAVHQAQSKVGVTADPEVRMTPWWTGQWKAEQ